MLCEVYSVFFFQNVHIVAFSIFQKIYLCFPIYLRRIVYNTLMLFFPLSFLSFFNWSSQVCLITLSKELALHFIKFSCLLHVCVLSYWFLLFPLVYFSSCYFGFTLLFFPSFLSWMLLAFQPPLLHPLPKLKAIIKVLNFPLLLLSVSHQVWNVIFSAIYFS